MNLPITPSKYQAAIFDHIQDQFSSIPGLSNSRQNVTISGVAGCGKTKTLEIGIKYFIPDNVRVLAVAYNSSIAKELETRVPGKTVKTYHALGLWAIRNSGIQAKIENEKTGKKTTIILKSFLDRYLWGRHYYGIAEMVSAIKNDLLQDDMSDAVLYEIATNKGIDIGDNWEVIFDAVRRVVRESMEMTDFIDFDDMVWFPAIFDWINVPQFDAILVDEVQDTNKPQRILISKALKPGGFIAGIGDSKQSIYAFRGADSDAMNQFSDHFGAINLPLSISYRCPKAIVNYVNRNFPEVQFEAADWAIDGSIATKKVDDVDFTPGTLVMCRTNAPLVPLAYRLIRRGINAQVRGRDIGRNLRGLIRQMGADTVPNLLEKLTEYRDRETYKLNRAERPLAAMAIQDKVETIFHLSTRANTLDELDRQIDTIFTTSISPVTLTTGHGAKGLEADKTVVLRPDLIPHPYAKTDVERDQETNLHYVIATRTKNEMVFLENE